MAITRRYNSGLETGSLGEISGRVSNGGTAASISTTADYTGTYGLRTEGSSLFYGCGYTNFPATRQVRIGQYFRVASSGTSSQRTAIAIRSASANVFTLRIANTGAAGLYVAGTLRDSSTGYYATWMHLGIDVYIHSTVGWINIYKDGELDMSYSGNTGNVDIVQMRMGKQEQSNYAFITFHDDIYIDDTAGEGSPDVVPKKRFHPLTISGAGNYAQWDPSAGSNYACVDEIPPSDADYVSTNVADELDSYAMTTHTLAEEEVPIALIPTARILRATSTEEFALGTRYSATDLVGSDQIPTAAYAYYWERQETKPGGGSWDQASIDAVEGLIKSRGSY